jgi:hypothetical protein
MRFLVPQFWWLALLALVPVALYLFKRRSRPVSVSTMVFFRWLAREHQDSAWLRRLKHWVSFALTLLLFLLPVVVLSRWSFLPSSEGARSVVILLDRSASMAATDERGRTRLEDAKAVVASRLAALGQDVRVALVAYDARPELIEARTLQRRAVMAALDRLQIRPVAGDTAAALEMARAVAALETPAQIWNVADAPLTDHEAPMPDGVRLISIPVALPEPVNAGITAFRIRPDPLQGAASTAFVQVSAGRASAGPVEGTLLTRVGDRPLPSRAFRLRAGESAGFEIPLSGAAGERFRVDLQVPGDRMRMDDVLLAEVPQRRPVVAVRVGPRETVDPYVHLALQSLVEEGSLEIWSAQPEQWPVPNIDVAIFDHWLPAEWPRDMPVILVNPPGGLGPIRGRSLGSMGLPRPEIREADPDHPVVYRVRAGGMSLTQTCVVEATGSLEPLWESPDGEPLLVAGTSGGQRVVALAFSPQRSEGLPLTAALPLLIGNALYWCAEGREGESREGWGGGRTGEVVDTGGAGLKWTVARGEGEARETEPLVAGRTVVELGRQGIWEDGSGRRGTAHLLSRAESDLPGAVAGAGGEEAVRRGTGSLAAWLLGTLLALLLAEGWLFHRHGVS